MLNFIINIIYQIKNLIYTISMKNTRNIFHDKYRKEGLTMELNVIKTTLANINNQKNMLGIIMEIERTIDETGLYSYLNWDKGELVDGPRISKYWVTTKWMYLGDEMPDPRGTLRLQKIGCKVDMEQDVFKKPVKIYHTTDWEDPVSKKAKLEDIPVWIVTVMMPSRYIDMYDVDYTDDEAGDELVDNKGEEDQIKEESDDTLS